MPRYYTDGLNMSLVKCCSCDHEWEGNLGDDCDWCGGIATVLLLEETQFEEFVRALYGEDNEQS